MYRRTSLDKGRWIISSYDYETPKQAINFAFDTETLVYLDGNICTQDEMYEKLKDCKQEEMRQRLYNEVWSWQLYDEINGFFMTNSFDEFLKQICRCKYKFGWCYNSTFDFAQIDYQILAVQRDKWSQHIDDKTSKSQAWTYESLHNAQGARYSYKLWIPYRTKKDRHTYVHSVQFNDFMKLVVGGLEKLLIDLEVEDNEGTEIRKLEMNYQGIDTNNLTSEEIAYCENDVKGLYFAIKKFNGYVEQQSDNTCHCFGKSQNLMTAGGFAKQELLRSMYPAKKNKKHRLQQYQREHPITLEQDKYFREHHLYRGGISFVNPRYKGKLIKDRLMYRYDVNSEYPYAMSIIRDLVGKPFKIPYKEWLKRTDKEDYECIMCLTQVSGELKPNMLGVWYNPFRQQFVDDIDEFGLHLMYEEEFNEMCEWYDIDFACDDVILVKRGGYSYKPFVDANYELKAQAKKDGNKTLQQVAKLMLNSSYGKLAERVERATGHYELNEETQAIHFVQDSVETEMKGAMSVLVGAKVTSVARCYILSKIREICPNPQKDFVYIDTDSIHCFNDYDKADAYTLGGLKLEATCEAIKYVLPKTYIDIEKLDEDELAKLKDIEIHTKGINVSAVTTFLKGQANKDTKVPLLYIDDAFDYGQKYRVLQSMNVKGGKVLIPVDKYLAREELRNDNLFVNNGYFNER